VLAALGGDWAICAYVFGYALTAFSRASSFTVRMEEDGRVFTAALGGQLPTPRLGSANSRRQRVRLV
jgi:hypothetical protein